MAAEAFRFSMVVISMTCLSRQLGNRSQNCPRRAEGHVMTIEPFLSSKPNDAIWLRIMQLMVETFESGDDG